MSRMVTPRYQSLPLQLCRPTTFTSCSTRSTGLPESFARSRVCAGRTVTTTARRLDQQTHRKEAFSSQLRSRLGATKIKWHPIPISLGIGSLGVLQFLRIQQRRKEEELFHSDATQQEEEDGKPRPRKRDRIRPSGPWQVQIMSTLPLKAVSRLWGRFNELTIPYYLRVPGFKLYSWVFGVNLAEATEQDLHVFPNLASFFYRTLKPGVRPLDPDPNALLSPADGKVVQFGTIEKGEVEQVKGVTYSLDALLGSDKPSSIESVSSNVSSSASSPKPSKDRTSSREGENVNTDEEFASVNGISYTLPNLFSGSSQAPGTEGTRAASVDQSTGSKPKSEAVVTADLALSKPSQPWWSPFASSPKAPTTLYYMVVYLAPGDYHRFHSPVSWVVSARRHFAGELYSVSPYLQRTLPGLFTLNERIVLLGRWRYGFFSYTPVGATNVGSIVVNFDRELRTNSLTTDTAADRAAEAAKERGEPYSGYSEAHYENASSVLGGHPLKRGEEMGGFQLGSTIVMVFEAPKGSRKSFDEGYGEGQRQGGWQWHVKKGETVKVGQSLGTVMEDNE